MAMAIVTSNVVMTAYADPLGKEISDVEIEYKSAQEKVEEIDAKIQKLDNEISNIIVENRPKQMVKYLKLKMT